MICEFCRQSHAGPSSSECEADDLARAGRVEVYAARVAAGLPLFEDTE